MMILPRDRVSVIIPAYNEAVHIGPCLDALAVQTVMPDEVIVVDNNSTDGTADIARRYPFVRVVPEKSQGKAYAREAGFRAAKGTVFARIDADTHVHPDWCAALQRSLAQHPEVAAITGKCLFYDLPGSRPASAAHAVLYHHFQRLLTGTEILWGTNMAVRRAAWELVRSECCMREDVDEDIDFTFLLHRQRQRIIRDKHILADVSALRGNIAPRDIARYLETWPKDYELHGMPRRANLIRVVVAASLAVIFVPALALSLHRRR